MIVGFELHQQQCYIAKKKAAFAAFSFFNCVAFFSFLPTPRKRFLAPPFYWSVVSLVLPHQ